MRWETGMARGASHRSLLETPRFQKAVIALPVEDDVIENFNANNLSSFLNLFGGIHV